MAQLAAQAAVNRKGAGSNPVGGAYVPDGPSGRGSQAYTLEVLGSTPRSGTELTKE